MFASGIQRILHCKKFNHYKNNLQLYIITHKMVKFMHFINNITLSTTLFWPYNYFTKNFGLWVLLIKFDILLFLSINTTFLISDLEQRKNLQTTFTSNIKRSIYYVLIVYNIRSILINKISFFLYCLISNNYLLNSIQKNK